MVAVTASVHDLGVAGLISGVGVTIEFSLLKPIVTIGDVVSVEPVLVPFSGGLASIVLPPSPVGNAYRVLVRGAGAQLAWYVIIPDVAAITLGTLILSNQVDPTTLTVIPADPVWFSSVSAEAATRAGADNVRIAVDAAQTFTDTQRVQGRANLQAAGYPTESLLQFYLPGDVIDYTGATSMSAIIQRGIDACAALVATKGPRVLHVPAGRYRLTTELLARTGVGIAGAGMDQTIFLPEGNQSGITISGINVLPPDLGGVGQTYNDCHFSGFTVDATNQDNTTPSLSVKGIFIQFMQRGSFTRVKVMNTLGTGFGCDYMRGVVFNDCIASGAGRSATGNTGAGAGFGVATGYYATERCTIINCLADTNKTAGFFTENKTTGPSLFSAGFSLISSRATGNAEGFRDGGSSGAIVQACQFIGNLRYGVAIGQTPANGSGGKNGIITGCAISGNGLGGVQVEVTTGYRISGNTINANTGRGINRGTTDPASNVTISDNIICSNSESGIGFLTSGVVVTSAIVNNDIYDNGTDVVSTFRDGITITGGTTNLTIRNNRIRNTIPEGNQRRAVDFRGAGTTSIAPVVQGNDVRGNAFADALRVQQIVALTTHVKENIFPGFAWSDTFNRANAATLGIASTGDAKTWQSSSSAVVAIDTNMAAVYSGDSIVRNAIIDSGSVDGAGVFTVTLTTAGAQRRGRTIVRGGGPDSTTHIALEHRTTSVDFKYRVLTRSGTVDTVVFTSPTVASADGDVHEITQTPTGDVTVKVNAVVLYSGNIPYATVPASGRHGMGGTSGASDARYDNASFVPA